MLPLLPDADTVPDDAVKLVADLTLTRTQVRVGTGSDTGTFTEHTKPTAVQVKGFIASSARRVQTTIGKLDRYVDSEIEGSIVDVVTTRAAALVERTVDPSTSSRDDSSYARLMEQFTEDLDVLKDAAREVDSDGSVDAGEDLSPRLTGVDEADCYRHRHVWW